MMFIGGSLHILTAEDYPLPPAFETAYRQSGQVVFETDVSKMESPEFQQYLLREVSFSDGRNLREVLRADTYLAVEDFFVSRGMSMTSIDGFKPGMVATLMTMAELQRLGVNVAGVDTHLDQRAAQDRKRRGQLETVEQQVAFIANLGVGQEDEMLNYNLADMQRFPELWQSMSRAWRRGDLPWLEENIALPMRNDFPRVYESLVVERNNAWIPQLEAIAKTAQVEFVVVGALHLSGTDGLISQLAARGYRIIQLP
ncbi:MAG: TraB/GumN family protein [Gammaproteobacteria bacterium]|nr:TraB/GumN family protein [Gammaproteobacteria bacterium]